MSTPLMKPAEQVGHLRVAMLSLPERTEAVLEFFFSTTGASQFSAAGEEEAEAAVFDADTPASLLHWQDFRQRTGRPGIALAAQPTDWPGTVWVRKPVTPAAMTQAAARVAELMRQAPAGASADADSAADVAETTTTAAPLRSTGRVVIALPVATPQPTPIAAPAAAPVAPPVDRPVPMPTPLHAATPDLPTPPEPEPPVAPLVPAPAPRQAIDTTPMSTPQPAPPRQGWLRRLLMRWLGWGPSAGPSVGPVAAGAAAHGQPAQAVDKAATTASRAEAGVDPHQAPASGSSLESDDDAASDSRVQPVETASAPQEDSFKDGAKDASATVDPQPVAADTDHPSLTSEGSLPSSPAESEDVALAAAAQTPTVKSQTTPSRLLRTVPPEELALEAAFCGLRDDLPWGAFATDPSLHYAAETSLMDAVREARLIGRKWPAPTQLEQDSVRVVIDGRRNLLHVEPDQEALTGMLTLALPRRPKTRTFSHAESKAWQERAQHIGACLPLEHTLWSLSLQASQGRLPIGTDPARTVYLKHWPNLTRLPRTPHALRIAALWATRGASLVDTVETLNIPQRHVVAFYNAVRAIDLITDDGSQILRAQRKANRNSKVLSRLMGWLSR